MFDSILRAAGAPEQYFPSSPGSVSGEGNNSSALGAIGEYDDMMAMEPADWKEITKRKEDYFEILNLLLSFDEKTGRLNRQVDPSAHWMRRVIQRGDHNETRILIRSLGKSDSFTYTVILEHENKNGFIVTGYVHEDGIRIERELSSEHPSHAITCLTDLLQFADVVDTSTLNPATVRLMNTINTATGVS